jgi:hypothetical protein
MTLTMGQSGSQSLFDTVGLFCSDTPTAYTLEWGVKKRRPPVAPDPRDQEWYSLAEQASKEPDQTKLLALIAQLCTALDERTKPFQEQAA